MGCAPSLQAQTQWQTVEPSPVGSQTINSWETVPSKGLPANSQAWEPLSPEEETLEPEQLVWTKPALDLDNSRQREDVFIENKAPEEINSDQKALEEGFRWSDCYQSIQPISAFLDLIIQE